MNIHEYQAKAVLHEFGVPVSRGVPIVIGAGGVEKIVSIELSAEEKAMLEKSAAAVREVIEAGKKL